MKTTLLFIFSTGLMLLPVATFAASTPLPTNSSTTTFDPASSLPGSLNLLADTGVMSFTGYNNLTQMFTGTLDAQVYVDTTTGDLDFLYQIADTGGDAMERATMTDFTGYATAVNYITSSGTVAPTSADRSQTGDTVGFNFSIPNTIGNGESTYWLEIDTNATTYVPGTVNVHDGGIATMAAFAPAPEPGTVGLLGFALTGLGLLQGKLRRKA